MGMGVLGGEFGSQHGKFSFSFQQFGWWTRPLFVTALTLIPPSG